MSFRRATTPPKNDIVSPSSSSQESLSSLLIITISSFRFLFGFGIGTRSSSSSSKETWSPTLLVFIFFDDCPPIKSVRISRKPCATRENFFRNINLLVSFSWHGVHSVRKFEMSQVPPPSATGIMWSPCQKWPSLGSVKILDLLLILNAGQCLERNRFRCDVPVFDRALIFFFEWFSCGMMSQRYSSDLIQTWKSVKWSKKLLALQHYVLVKALKRRNMSCASRPHIWHTPRSSSNNVSRISWPARIRRDL